ncbi:MAG: hypothetical protein UIM53_02155 [Acutalibacteraceae bacterium]|nr:hypothetical protein [Acutalibacteraceae bacterium]
MKDLKISVALSHINIAIPPAVMQTPISETNIKGNFGDLAPSLKNIIIGIIANISPVGIKQAPVFIDDKIIIAKNKTIKTIRATRDKVFLFFGFSELLFILFVF